MKIKANSLTGRLAIFALAACSSACFAQGTAFTYQGQLNEGGAPADGLYDIAAGLFAASSGGSPVAGPITNSAVPVTNGLFTIVLDYGDVFTGPPYWLQLEVRTNGSSASFSTLSPRQQITPAPYAIFANTASNLSGTLSAGQLTGVYSDIVSISNAADTFTGNGGGLTLNASKLTSGTVPDARLAANVARTNQVWLLGGNAGVATGDNVIGTTDNQFVDIRADNLRVMRYAYGTDASGLYSNAPNILGGSPVNYIAPGLVGATISGGGGTIINPPVPGYFTGSNIITADFGTIGGGMNNSAGTNATVAGGLRNIASGANATIGGGFENIASGPYSLVAGGAENVALSVTSSALGGSENTASNFYATVCGGDMNVAGGNSSFIGGGIYNLASGEGSVVPGGISNEAFGVDSFAAGEGASAQFQNSFVWSDGSDYPGQFADTGPYQFLISASGGVGIGTSDPLAQLHVLSGGGLDEPQVRIEQTVAGGYARLRMKGSGLPIWDIASGGSAVTLNFFYAGNAGASGTNVLILNRTGNATLYGTLSQGSDRNHKNNIKSIDPQTVLDKVAALPISTWDYITEPGVPHLGPMAQDFYAAFNLGADDKHITTIDEGGVALAAIQGLNQKLQEKDAQILALQQRLDKLERLLDQHNPSSQ